MAGSKEDGGARSEQTESKKDTPKAPAPSKEEIRASIQSRLDSALAKVTSQMAQKGEESKALLAAKSAREAKPKVDSSTTSSSSSAAPKVALDIAKPAALDKDKYKWTPKVQLPTTTAFVKPVVRSRPTRQKDEESGEAIDSQKPQKKKTSEAPEYAIDESAALSSVYRWGLISAAIGAVLVVLIFLVIPDFRRHIEIHLPQVQSGFGSSASNEGIEGQLGVAGPQGAPSPEELINATDVFVGEAPEPDETDSLSSEPAVQLPTDDTSPADPLSSAVSSTASEAAAQAAADGLEGINIDGMDQSAIEQTVKSAVSKAMLEFMRQKALQAADPDAQEEKKKADDFAADPVDADSANAPPGGVVDKVMQALKRASGLSPTADPDAEEQKAQEEGPKATTQDVLSAKKKKKLKKRKQQVPTEPEAEAEAAVEAETKAEEAETPTEATEEENRQALLDDVLRPGCSARQVFMKETGQVEFDPSVLNHTLTKLITSTLVDQPYEHMVIEDYFEPTFYQCILAHLPPGGKMGSLDPVNEISAFRYRVDIHRPGRLGPTPEEAEGAKVNRLFWRAFVKAFGSDEIALLWVTKFRRSTQPRLETKQIPGPWEEEKFFTAGTNDTIVTATNFTYAMDLTRDLDGYEQLPHTDSGNRWVSTVMYLPRSADRLDAGTSVIRSAQGRVSQGGTGRTPWKEGGFEVARQVEYKPNSVFAFAPCDRSWHAVKRFSHPTPRDSIQGFVLSSIKIGKQECFPPAPKAAPAPAKQAPPKAKKQPPPKQAPPAKQAPPTKQAPPSSRRSRRESRG